jgi:hypothetical protein
MREAWRGARAREASRGWRVMVSSRGDAWRARVRSGGACTPRMIQLMSVLVLMMMTMINPGGFGADAATAAKASTNADTNAHANDPFDALPSCGTNMRKVWTSATHAAVYATPDVSDARFDGERAVTVITTSGRVRAYDGSSGDVLDWSFAGRRIARAARGGVVRVGARRVAVALDGVAMAFNLNDDGSDDDGEHVVGRIPSRMIRRDAFVAREGEIDAHHAEHLTRAPNARRLLEEEPQPTEANEASLEDILVRDDVDVDATGSVRLDSEHRDDAERYALETRVLSAPTAGDVDGDGFVEIVVAASYYYTPSSQYVATGVVILDGATLAVKKSFDLDRVQMVRSRESTKVYAPPTLADVDGDGTLDVIVGTTAGNVHVISGVNGAPARGWPQTMSSIEAQVVAVDVDADGDVDLIACDTRGRVAAFSASGEKLWTRELHSKIAVAASVGDIDGDGALEVVVGTLSGAVHVLRGKDGALASSASPAYIASDKILAPIVLSRIRPGMKDPSVLDIVIATHGGVVHIIDGKVRCRDVIEVDGEVYAAPVVGDVTGAGTVDIIVSTMSGHVHAFQSIGSTFEPALRTTTDHVALKNWFSVTVTDREYRDVRGSTMDVRYEIVDRRFLNHVKVKRSSLAPYEVDITVTSAHGKSDTTRVSHPRPGKYTTRVAVPLTKTRGEIRVSVRDGMYVVVDDAVSVSFHEYFDVALKWLVALPFLLASTTIIRYANKDALERDVFGSASIPHFAFGGKHA